MATKEFDPATASDEEIGAAFEQIRAGGSLGQLEDVQSEEEDFNEEGDDFSPSDEGDAAEQLDPSKPEAEAERGPREPGSVPVPVHVAEKSRRLSAQERIRELEKELAETRGTIAAWDQRIKDSIAARELRQREEQAAALQRQRELELEAQAKAKEEADPEPDKVLDPDAWLEWRIRQQDERLAALSAELARAREEVNLRTEHVEVQQVWKAIEQDVNQHEQIFASAKDEAGNLRFPGYYDALKWLEDRHLAEALVICHGNEAAAQQELQRRKLLLLGSCFNTNPQTGRPDPRFGWRVSMPSQVYALAKQQGWTPPSGKEQGLPSDGYRSVAMSQQPQPTRRALGPTGIRASEREAAIARATAAARGQGAGVTASVGGPPDIATILGYDDEQFAAFMEENQDLLTRYMGR